MAILEEGEDEYEVTIKRHPAGTYFEEHIKIGDREKLGCLTRDRYIVSEAGMAYTIEVRLKKGFNFGVFCMVRAKLFFPGQKENITVINLRRPSSLEKVLNEDMVKNLEFADVELNGKKMLGTRFAFRSLIADEGLKNETDVSGVCPKNLSYFTVKVKKLRSETKSLSKPYLALSKPSKPSAKILGSSETERTTTQVSQRLWEAEKVDKDSFSKDGITCAVGFVGGRPDTLSLSTLPSKESSQCSSIPQIAPSVSCKTPSRMKTTWHSGPELTFNFHYRPAEFLERVGIVKDPPPLHVYAWNELSKEERPIALKELQDINKEQVRQALEAKTGAVHQKSGRKWKMDEPKEWRSWSKMYEEEKELSFKTLQAAKKAYDRGEALRSFETNSGEIISLITNEPKADHMPGAAPKKTSTKEEDAGVGINKTPIKYEAGENKSQELEENMNIQAQSAPEPAEADALPAGNENSINHQGREQSQLPEDCQSRNSPSQGEPEVKPEIIDLDSLESPPPPTRKNKSRGMASWSTRFDDELLRKKEKARKLAEEIESEERLAKPKRQRRELEEEIEIEEAERSKKEVKEEVKQE